jgi:signal transduction histidine kinase
MKERYLFVYIDAIAAGTICFWVLPPAANRFPEGLACWIGTVLFLSVYLLMSYMKTKNLTRFVPFIIAVAICIVYIAFTGIEPTLSKGVLIIVVALVFLAFTAYCIKTLSRREYESEKSESKSIELERYREVMQSRQRMEKTAEQVFRLTERNRLATRIHDEIGHGMSGSILMLEGATMIMDSDPEKAKHIVRTVTENMRSSVDEIRRVLRDERSENADISLAQIENELNIFESSHPGIGTEFITKGDLSRVPQTIWHCIYENLREALTNTLKHSHAIAFRVEIENINLLLKVVFTDRTSGDLAEIEVNPGRIRNELQKGIGLQNIEERCAICYGRSFFEKTPIGFQIKMTFPQKEMQK